MLKKHLVLFDIDGTLVDCRGAGTRAFFDAGTHVFGDAFENAEIRFAGGVDRGLLKSIAQQCHFVVDEDALGRFKKSYFARLSESLNNTAAPYAHALDIVDRAHENPSIAVGLLTGNFREAAYTKVRSCRFHDDAFPIGAFGCDAEQRNDLVPVALRRAHEFYGHVFSPENVLVVGDTPADIACAAAHGCKSFAVATGQYDRRALHSADFVADTLEALHHCPPWFV